MDKLDAPKIVGSEKRHLQKLDTVVAEPELRFENQIRKLERCARAGRDLN